MEECSFCRITSKEIPSKISAESAGAIAFHDINPQAPVHVLVVPKEHIPSLLHVRDSDSEILAELVLLARKSAITEKIEETGFRLVLNCGPDAGQSVDHLHLHLLGKRKLNWPPG